MIFIREITESFTLRDFQIAINSFEARGLTVKEIKTSDRSFGFGLVLIAIFNPVTHDEAALKADIAKLKASADALNAAVDATKNQ